MIPTKPLSRDDRKLLNIERIFKKQDEEEKRKLSKKRKLVAIEEVNVIFTLDCRKAQLNVSRRYLVTGVKNLWESRLMNCLRSIGPRKSTSLVFHYET